MQNIVTAHTVDAVNFEVDPNFSGLSLVVPSPGAKDVILAVNARGVSATGDGSLILNNNSTVSMPIIIENRSRGASTFGDPTASALPTYIQTGYLNTDPLATFDLSISIEGDTGAASNVLVALGDGSCTWTTVPALASIKYLNARIEALEKYAKITPPYADAFKTDFKPKSNKIRQIRRPTVNKTEKAPETKKKYVPQLK